MQTPDRSSFAFVDWLGARFLIVVGALSIPLGILQPLLWKAWFNEPPPATSADAGAVITLMVTLLTFALAAYGIVAYQALRTRLESELAQQLERRMSEGLKPAIRSMHLVAARHTHAQSLQAWRQCEDDLWFRKHAYDPSFEESASFRSLVDQAIYNAEEALQLTETIEPRDDAERLSVRYEILNALAYYLALRRGDGD